ncbi:MAG TPA: cytochrome c peroxidase [Steroidobacteraceae bacterium]
MIRALLLACLILSIRTASGLAAPEEPITPLPAPATADPLKIALGERLFSDSRLSGNNGRSCVTCHNLELNGASQSSFDTTPDGSPLTLNTLTVFNSALNFRFGWEGKPRTLERGIADLLSNPKIMNCASGVAARKLAADPAMHDRFKAAYGRGPDAQNVPDALAVFLRSLLTPGSRFDRWLLGEANALSEKELAGYRLFKSLGCIACHQGMNVGGNLYERHGIFHPLARPDPVLLRVPSLRNVATTGPYFHDGSAPTLQAAVRAMGRAQLNSTLTDAQVDSIVAFLHTLTGVYRGKPVGEAE